MAQAADTRCSARLLSWARFSDSSDGDVYVLLAVVIVLVVVQEYIVPAQVYLV